MRLFRIPADEDARRLMVRIFVALVVVLVLAIVGAFLFIYPPTGSWIRSSFARLERHILPRPHTVLMRTATGNARYTVSGTTLALLPPQSAHTHAAFFVSEDAASLAGGTPSLGSPSPDAPARTLALVTDSGRLVALASSIDPKRDLALRTDGLVAYSAFITSTSTAPAAWHVLVDDATTLGEARDLGLGMDPAFAKNGNILALSSQGLIEINPFVGARMVRLAAPYASAPGPALIAPDATYAVLPNSVTGKEDVFSIDPARPSVMSYLGSVPMPTALGALTATSFLAQTDAGNATSYTVSASGISQGGTFTITH